MAIDDIRRRFDKEERLNGLIELYLRPVVSIILEQAHCLLYPARVSAQVPAARQSDNIAFSLCLGILRKLAKAGAADKDVLTHFLLERFSEKPDAFENFLHKIAQSLRDRREKDLATQYLDVLSPLAEHFGMFRRKRRLDALCFSIAHPRESAEVERTLEKYKRESSRYLGRITRALRSWRIPRFAEHGIRSWMLNSRS